MGILDSSGVYEINGLVSPYKGTLSLSSVAAGRKIELSVNGGCGLLHASIRRG